MASLRKNFRARLRMLGPGLLLAGIAIGVSHLVQSTRAGANFGFQVAFVIIVIHVVKYPFFEYGHRYAAAKGESLLHGYLRLGRVYLTIFLLFQVIAALAGVAAVTKTTAALAENLFGFGWHPTIWSMAIMGVCAALLLGGDYRWLDRCMKLVMAALVAATVLAFIMAVLHGSVAPVNFQGSSPWKWTHLAFFIAIMGWMPAPIEISVYQSLWVGAHDESQNRRTSVSEAKFDFNFGYALSLIMALLFLGLGALIMYGSGTAFADNGVVFAGQVVSLYTHALGEWSRPIIALAAFTALFSTSLTVIDANPRTFSAGIRLALPNLEIRERSLRRWILGLLCAVELLIIHFLELSFTRLIDLAITIGFLAAPVFAALNFRLITSSHVAPADQPGNFLRALSWFGILFFIVFSIVYLIHRFG